MARTHRFRYLAQAFLFILLHPSFDLHGQCNNQITAEDGNTQQFACTDVTVSASGGFWYNTNCNMGPYGCTDGSFTFTFSKPIRRVILGFQSLNYHLNPPVLEEATLEINGLPFPFPSAGSPFPCNDVHAIVSPSGSLQSPHLEPGLLLQYVLCSDSNNILGSIVSTSNAPSFAFNPNTMQTNTPYYVAAVVGDNLNGNVDLNSDCLDFSNAVEVNWLALPTVSFSMDDPNICMGNCAEVTTTFTGEPPFTLTYKNPFTGLQTSVFQDPVNTIQICAPPYMPPGSLSIQAIEVKDAYHCVCK